MNCKILKERTLTFQVVTLVIVRLASTNWWIIAWSVVALCVSRRVLVLASSVIIW